MNRISYGVLGAVLLLTASAVSCGDSGERASRDGTAAPPVAAGTPGAALTTTTVPMLVAWIDENEPEDGPAPLTVKFTSVVKGGTPPYSYKWDFDDGSEPSAEPHPMHTFTDAGLFWPELVVTDSRGQEDDDTTIIEAR